MIRYVTISGADESLGWGPKVILQQFCPLCSSHLSFSFILVMQKQDIYLSLISSFPKTQVIGVLREPGLDYVGEFGPPPSHHAQGSDLVEVSFTIIRPPGVAKDLRIQTFSFDVYVSSYQRVFKYCKLVTISLFSLLFFVTFLTKDTTGSDKLGGDGWEGRRLPHVRTRRCREVSLPLKSISFSSCTLQLDLFLNEICNIFFPVPETCRPLLHNLTTLHLQQGWNNLAEAVSAAKNPLSFQTYTPNLQQENTQP